MDRYLVEFQPLGRRAEVSAGTTLIEAAHQSGVAIASDCGGKGRCGRCRVEVIAGDVSPPDRDECNVLERNGASKTERLACRTQLQSDIKIYIPKTSRAYDHRLQVHGRLRPVKVDRIVPPEISSAEISSMGIAIDLGTTKIAGLLLDLESGNEIFSAGMVNPQISYGEDIISRLNYAIHEKKGTIILAHLLCKAIDGLIKTLCHNGGVSPDRITDITICGNTAISHLLLQLPVESLARAPYIAGFSTPRKLTAKNLDFKNTPDAMVLVLPCIGGFIGGDHVAMILACDLDLSPKTVLGVDIGTNTEIVLAKPGSTGGLFVTSCASGPALEGAHIRDGMRAASGAIEQIRLTTDGPVIKTVNGSLPMGLCGSGIVDALSELLRLGIIDKRGHLQTNNNTCSGSDGREYVLVPAENSGTGHDILITQQDISEVQLAKGAIQAGIQTLLARTDTLADEVDCVYLAGAFGSHLNIDSALSIGMLPDLPKARFIKAGNAAMVGASLALISKEERKRAAAIALRAQHVELAGHPQFTRLMARAMRFENENKTETGPVKDKNQ